MRIVCPACAAAYEVPEGRLQPGRVVRCARCDTDWAPIAEAPIAEAPVAEPVAPEPEPAHEVVEEVVAEPEPEPMPVVMATDRVMPPVERPRLGALRAAWGLSVVILLAAAWFGYSARETVMRAWPPSVRAYAALGLAGRH